MYLVPKSEITIGNVRLYGDNSGVNSVEITSSVTSLQNTAKITIPRQYAKKEGKGILDCIRTGDRVTIRLGCGDFHLRFRFRIEN